MTATITNVSGLQVLDSRGRPTVCALITLSDQSVHKVTVPSGASTGRHEALELRDTNSQRAEKFYSGKSVSLAVSHINELIAPTMIGLVPDVATIDQIMIQLDPTPRHEKLGANATLAVSLATLKAGAHSHRQSIARYLQPTGKLQLPMPMVNILSGGAHANGALDIQDVLVIPHGATNFSQALSWVVAIRESAAKRGAEQGFTTNLVADEGGLGIPFASSAKACEFVAQCIESVGLTAGHEVSIALDIAATQFFNDGQYVSRNSGKTFTSEQWSQQLLELLDQAPIISIEDPFAEDDWAAWKSFMTQLPRSIAVVGDDLFTTNAARLAQGIQEKSANSILIKPNQNGLVSSTFDVLSRAKMSNFATIVSARSGESEDNWLADIATGWSAGQIKVGSTHGSERTAKWNRLLELEHSDETVFTNPF
ncbi:MAG: phosphopyruvate hydratase [Actinobacteria bacterium]|nr:phosphopyruvate hydratase [Actinomycetota bacterium]